MPLKPNPLIKKLIRISKQVILDCVLENGAIVAANTDKDYTPREAANYRWVWPRDASFVSVAGDILGLHFQEKFFNWLNERPQDFKRDKLLYTNYSTNGRIGSMGKIAQIDQAGTVIWSICHHFQNNPRGIIKYKELIENLADGLSAFWDKNHFRIHTVDLWEEAQRQTTITVANNFTYSLAASARGLLCAYNHFPNHLWKETTLQMIAEIKKAYSETDKYFYRNHGKIDDKNIDASLLGLTWPFEIYEASDPKMISMVRAIEDKLVVDGGVHRFEFDYFDSEGAAWEGGGAWPLLNFWLAIYWIKRNDRKRALKYYNWVLDRIEKFNYYLPEQIFEDFRVGIYPLAWSHAMFIIASYYLDLIK